MSAFWNNTHALSPLTEEMQDRYVPASGATLFVQSECLRSVIKLHHDCYNNGFGNEMSQPIAYLERYFEHQATPEWSKAFRTIAGVAMEPWNKRDLDKEFDLCVADVLLSLKAAADTGALVPIAEEMRDMPMVLIDWPNDRYCYDDDDELE